MSMNKAVLNRVGLNITDQSFIKPKDYEFQTLESELSFRRTADGLNVRNGSRARVSSVKGNSVVWNQMFKMTPSSITSFGVTSTLQEDNSIQCSGTLTETHFNWGKFSANEANHIYLFTCSVDSNALDGKKFALHNRDVKITIQNGFAYAIHTNTSPTSQQYIGIDGFTIGDEISVNCQVNQYDLTKMFGVGNEPTTIEEFYARKPIVTDENAYNEGEVIHMEADAIKSVGVNQWDEEWENGSFDYSGNPISLNTKIRSKNFIPIIYGTNYYYVAPVSFNWYLYDENFKCVGTWTGGALDFDSEHPAGEGTLSWPVKSTKKFPRDVRYVKFSTFGSTTTTYNNDICINLSDTEVNGQYFPYVKREESLEVIKKYFPNGMRSAGTAHDEIRYNKTTQKWEAVKRIGEVDMGTLNWTLSSTHNVFFSESLKPQQTNMPMRAPTGLGDVLFITSKYAVEGVASMGDATKQDKCAWCEIGYETIVVKDSSYTDVASFKTAMSGVMLYYELAEPIVTEIEENFNLDYEVWNAGTEQMIADTTSTPVLANIRYKVNK